MSVFTPEGFAERYGNIPDSTKLISAIGLIVPGETGVSPEDTLTRECAARAAVILFDGGKSPDVITDETSVFKDVELENDNYYFIRSACRNGLMSASDGYFCPDRGVSYTELMKILVSAAGLGQTANACGGYPDGYLSVASTLGFGKKNVSSAEKMTVGDFSRILEDCLDKPIARISFKNGVIQYEFDEGECFLDRMDIKTISGTVTANCYTDIYGKRELDTDMVAIDDEIFNSGNTNISDYIGADTTAYYHEDNKENRTILYFSGKKFEELTLSAKDLGRITDNGSVINVEYESGNKTKSIKVSNTAREFYNEAYNGGAELYDNLNSVLKNLNGSLRFFDNDGDGKYDVVHIYEYVSYVVDRVDIDAEKIYLFDSRQTYISFGDKVTERTIVIRNGEKSSISDLKKNDIIDVGYSRGGKIIKITTTGLNDEAELDSAKVLEGRLISIDEKDGYATFSIDGLIYDTTTDFWKRNKDSVVVGYTYVFYMNAEKKIAYFKAEDTGEKYGFLMNIMTDDDENTILLKILTTDNKINIYESNGFNLYDGGKSVGGNVTVRINNCDEARANTTLFDRASGRTNRQMIRYFVNDWNKITVVKTGRVDFCFDCISVTEVNDDGTWKSGINTSEYTEDDFIIRKIEKLNPLTYSIYVNKSGSNGGLVPINVSAPEVINDNDVSLRINYQNFDIGKYIGDDKEFAFFKYRYSESGSFIGLKRDSFYDYGDKLKSVPGRTLRLQHNTMIDQRYLLCSSTAVFSVALEMGEDNNIKVSNTADDLMYKAILPSEITANYGAPQPFILYDIKKNHSVGAAILGDVSTLPFGGRNYFTKGVISKKPVIAIDEDGEPHLKIFIKDLSSQDLEFFCETDNLKDEGMMMRYYDSSGKFIGPKQVEYYGPGDSRVMRQYNKVKGMYEGKDIRDLDVGAVIYIRINNEKKVCGFSTMFDGDTEQPFYEERPEGLIDEWGMNTKELEKENYPGQEYIDISLGNLVYGNKKNVGGDGQETGINYTTKYFIYGSIKDIFTDGDYNYALVETRLPSFDYADRIGTWQGSHELIFKEDDGNMFLTVERLVEINSRTRIYCVDEDRNNVEQKDISYVHPGDKVAMYQPQFEYDGVVVVYGD